MSPENIVLSTTIEPTLPIVNHFVDVNGKPRPPYFFSREKQTAIEELLYCPRTIRLGKKIGQEGLGGFIHLKRAIRS